MLTTVVSVMAWHGCDPECSLLDSNICARCSNICSPLADVSKHHRGGKREIEKNKVKKKSEMKLTIHVEKINEFESEKRGDVEDENHEIIFHLTVSQHLLIIHDRSEWLNRWSNIDTSSTSSTLS